MIGGIERCISTRAGDRSIEIAVRAIRLAWPAAVFENSATAERFGTLQEIPFGQIAEIFVYRDANAADRWDAEGAVSDLTNTMIHLIADPDRLTMVLDEQNEVMRAIEQAIASALHDEIHYLPAILEAA